MADSNLLEENLDALPYLYKADEYITAALGYAPVQHKASKHRHAVVNNVRLYFADKIDKKEFFVRLIENVRNLRNQDMRLFSFSKLEYTDEDYNQYHTHDYGVKEKARQRIIKIFGYAPELKYGLRAELWLRCGFLFSPEEFEPGWNKPAGMNGISELMWRLNIECCY